MGLMHLLLFFILMLAGHYMAKQVFPAFGEIYLKLEIAQKARVKALGLLFALPIIVPCLYLLDSSFPNGSIDFSSNRAKGIFFIVPLLLGNCLTLTKFAAIKVVTSNKKKHSDQ